jgi:hypothetical protein
VDRIGKLYLSVDYGTDLRMSARKRPKKARVGKPPTKRLRVDKDAFDGVLEKLIRSKPVKRAEG